MLVSNLIESTNKQINESQLPNTSRQKKINEKIWQKSRKFLSKRYGFDDDINLFEFWAKNYINDYGRLILQLDANTYLKKGFAKTKINEVKNYLAESQRQVEILLDNVVLLNPDVTNLSECLNLDNNLLSEQAASKVAKNVKPKTKVKTKTGPKKGANKGERDLTAIDAKLAQAKAEKAASKPATPAPKVKNPGDAAAVAAQKADAKAAADAAKKTAATNAKNARTNARVNMPAKGSVAGLDNAAQKEVAKAIQTVDDITAATRTAGKLTASQRQAVRAADETLKKYGRRYNTPVKKGAKRPEGLPPHFGNHTAPKIKKSDLAKTMYRRRLPKPKVVKGAKPTAKPTKAKLDPETKKTASTEAKKLSKEANLKSDDVVPVGVLKRLGNWALRNRIKTGLGSSGAALVGWGIWAALAEEDGELPKPPMTGGGGGGAGTEGGSAAPGTVILTAAQANQARRNFYFYAKQVTGINNNIKAGIEIMRLLVDAGYDVKTGNGTTPFAVLLNPPAQAAASKQPAQSAKAAADAKADRFAKFKRDVGPGSMTRADGTTIDNSSTGKFLRSLRQNRIQENTDNNIKTITNLWENWLISEQEVRGQVRKTPLATGVGTSGDGLQDTLSKAIKKKDSKKKEEPKTRKRIQQSEYAQYGVDGKWDIELHNAILHFQQDLVNAGKMPATNRKKRTNVDGIVGKTTYPFLKQMADGELKIARKVDPKPEAKPEAAEPELELQTAQDFINQRIDQQSAARLKEIDDQLNKAFTVNNKTTGKGLYQLKKELADQVNEFEMEGKEVPEKLQSRLNNIRRRIDTLEAIRDDILEGPKRRRLRKEARLKMKKATAQVFKLIRDKVLMFAERSGRTKQGRNVKSGNPVAVQVIAFARKYGLMDNPIFWVSWAARDIETIDIERKKSGKNPTDKLTTPPMPSEKTSKRFEALIVSFREALAIYQKAIPKKTLAKQKEKKKSDGTRPWYWWLFPPDGAGSDYYDIGSII